MAYGEANHLVIDDVARPRKVKVVTPICLSPGGYWLALDRLRVQYEHYVVTNNRLLLLLFLLLHLYEMSLFTNFHS